MLRAVAALSVVLIHAVSEAAVAQLGEAGKVAPTVLAVGASASVGVYLFFVISGFCIHLRVARAIASGGAPKIDFIPFWRRRFRRLYPAYLAALCLALFAAVIGNRAHFDMSWGWDILSHLLMVHNFDVQTVYSINPVFWTLAVEEQLYLAYFLLLLIRVRYGWGVTLAVTLAVRVAWFAIGFTLHRVLGLQIVISESAAANWCIWALGALAVESIIGIINLPAWLRSGRTAAAVFGVTFAVFVADRFTSPSSPLHDVAWLVLQPLWGFGAFVLLNWAVRLEKWWVATERISGSIVQSLAGIGVFSYSLYLVHEVVLTTFHDLAFVSPVLFVTGVIAVSLASAWIFFLMFERPHLPVAVRHAEAKLAQPA